MSVGKALCEDAVDLWDSIIGMLAQAIGYWWGDEGNVASGIQVIKDTIELINDKKYAVRHIFRDVKYFLPK